MLSLVVVVVEEEEIMLVEVVALELHLLILPVGERVLAGLVDIIME